MKRKIGWIMLSLCLIVVGGCLAVVWNHEQGIALTEITDVDLAQVVDGTYVGSYGVFPVAAKVKVTVLDHHITGIELVRHRNGQGQPAEVLIDQVVAAQSLQVDVISGATASSKVILQAIANALQLGSR